MASRLSDQDTGVLGSFHWYAVSLYCTCDSFYPKPALLYLVFVLYWKKFGLCMAMRFFSLENLELANKVVLYLIVWTKSLAYACQV